MVQEQHRRDPCDRRHQAVARQAQRKGDTSLTTLGEPGAHVEPTRFDPDVLEGEPVYLSLLARAATRRAVKVPTIRAVILTYGKASLEHGRRIAEAFPAPQVDLYGSTEAGYLFVGEAFRDNSRVIDENAFIELVPWRRGVEGVHQIHVTTRGREAMPLLRYRTGDIVMSRPGGFRILGRERDLYFSPDGSLVSASDVDAETPQTAPPAPSTADNWRSSPNFRAAKKMTKKVAKETSEAWKIAIGPAQAMSENGSVAPSSTMPVLT